MNAPVGVRTLDFQSGKQALYHCATYEASPIVLDKSPSAGVQFCLKFGTRVSDPSQCLDKLKNRPFGKVNDVQLFRLVLDTSEEMLEQESYLHLFVSPLGSLSTASQKHILHCSSRKDLVQAPPLYRYRPFRQVIQTSTNRFDVE